MSSVPPPSQRTQQILAEINSLHFPARQIDSTSQNAASKNLVLLDNNWNIRLCGNPTKLQQIAVEDFQTFLRKGWGIEIPLSDVSSTRQITLQCETTTLEFDRQDPTFESFTIHATPDSIRIEAKHERGLLQATHYLERQFLEQGMPGLTLGTEEHTPAFMPRISNGVFIFNRQTPDNPGNFPDSYLSLMSHYGVNGIHFYLNLYKICRSSVLPELNSEGFEQEVEKLRQHTRRLLDHGIDLYLHINTPPIQETHPVFQNHPEVLGARVEIFMDSVSGLKWNNLCSHSPKTLAFYKDALQQLYTAAPELAGAVIIIGGECFFQCYTRPKKTGNERTNCPVCKDLHPDVEIANLTNVLAEAVKSTGKHKSLYAWPYSAFVWSGEDKAQLGWIDHLSEDVSVLSNYDCGVPDSSCGNLAWLYDYNIKLTEPSAIFASQQERLKKHGRPIYTKTETNTTPDAFSLPYLPLHYRWIERFRNMHKHQIAGLVSQWRFYGMNATPPEEWQYQITWNPQCSNDEILQKWVQHTLGVPASDVQTVLQAWRHISDSWEDYPYSAMTSGERQAYMRGPMYIGPAQPLIFDVQDHYDLDERFWLKRGDSGELNEKEDAVKRRRQKPRYISDLLITAPFKWNCIEKLNACIARYEQGAEMLDRVLARSDTPQAQRERDIVFALLIQLRTLRNVVRFYRARDAIHQKEIGLEDFNRLMDELSNILREEIANAESALPILKRQPSVGYGHCYTEAYDYDLVADKIRQCRYVLEKELPRFSAVIRFHIWLDF